MRAPGLYIHTHNCVQPPPKSSAASGHLRRRPHTPALRTDFSRLGRGGATAADSASSSSSLAQIDRLDSSCFVMLHVFICQATCAYNTQNAPKLVKGSISRIVLDMWKTHQVPTCPGLDMVQPSAIQRRLENRVLAAMAAACESMVLDLWEDSPPAAAAPGS